MEWTSIGQAGLLRDERVVEHEFARTFGEQELHLPRFDLSCWSDQLLEFLHGSSDGGLRLAAVLGNVGQLEMARAGFMQAIVKDALGAEEALVDVAGGPF